MIALNEVVHPHLGDMLNLLPWEWPLVSQSFCYSEGSSTIYTRLQNLGSEILARAHGRSALRRSGGDPAILA